MKVVFLSNFLNHHQLPMCQALRELTEGNFYFVATTPIGRERRSLGYFDMNSAYPFVIRTYEGQEQRRRAQQLTNEADVVVLGSAPLKYLHHRLQNGKLTFLYSERLYKTGYEAWKLPVRLVRRWKQFGRYRSLYLLCASAYTAGDFAKTLTFLNKTYKWGYFPQTHRYEDLDAMMDHKKPTSILWAARFISWKHPEYVLEVARRLKAENYDFHIQMMGNGQLWGDIARQIHEQGLEEQVELVGAVPSDQVRAYMEAASIFLFTSDRNEGWGAVLNESMNSGCAVVADSAIGSVPFLVKNGENGLCYRSSDVEDLYQKVKFLLDHPAECNAMGKKAYETITETWNAETATDRLIGLCKALSEDPKSPSPYANGPCSKAEILKG